MDRHRTTVYFPATLALALAMVAGALPTRAQYGPVEPGPEDEIIATFEARQEGQREIAFSWTYEPSERDESLVCQLNFDGDEVVEQSISGCEDVHGATHTYDEPGRYTAILTVRSRDGGADTARVRVVAR